MFYAYFRLSDGACAVFGSLPDLRFVGFASDTNGRLIRNGPLGIALISDCRTGLSAVGNENFAGQMSDSPLCSFLRIAES